METKTRVQGHFLCYRLSATLDSSNHFPKYTNFSLADLFSIYMLITPSVWVFIETEVIDEVAANAKEWRSKSNLNAGTNLWLMSTKKNHSLTRIYTRFSWITQDIKSKSNISYVDNN